MPISAIFHSFNMPSKLCIALSGGMDSIVLLHLLVHLPAAQRPTLRAIHIHHGLQTEADQWADFCQAVCQSYHIPLHIERVSVISDGKGIEAAARHARYAAFERFVESDEWLATAHHQTDQAETFLLHALRASGVDGLAAMSPIRPLTTQSHCTRKVWRPLLGFSRSTLREYAKHHQFPWVDDPSNHEIDFDRNFLREEIFPLLRLRWPHLESALARSAALCAESVQLLHTDDAIYLQKIQRPAAYCAAISTLSLLDLWELPVARQARVLRVWVAQYHLPPLPAEGITQLQQQWKHSGSADHAQFSWQGYSLKTWRQHLFIEKESSIEKEPFFIKENSPTNEENVSIQEKEIAIKERSISEQDFSTNSEPVANHKKYSKKASFYIKETRSLSTNYVCDWRLPEKLMLPNGDTLQLHAINAGQVAVIPDICCRVGFRQGGERIHLPQRTHSHSIKKLLNASMIPPWIRPHLPIIYSPNSCTEIWGVADQLCSAELHNWLQHYQLKLVWQPHIHFTT